jgi:ferritin
MTGGLAMLHGRVESAINEQIKNELYSGYLYLAMAAHAESANLPGFGNWLRKQAEEELSHAMKLYAYVNERGGRVVLQQIDQPPVEFESPLKMFEQVYEHEQKVTALIHGLYEVATEAKDYATQSLLKWFIDEQVEEEANASLIVEQLKMAGGKGQALLMMDRSLAQR